MIEECAEIAERDREKIIKAVTSYSVKVLLITSKVW
jgi:hypothetical protein